LGLGDGTMLPPPRAREDSSSTRRIGYNSPVRRPIKIVLRLFTTTGLLVGAFGLAGGLVGACGSGAGDFCEKVQECEGGNEMDLEACGLSEDASADLAELHNCSSEYEEFFACKEESSRCNNKKYQVDAGTCDDVSEAYNKCIKN